MPQYLYVALATLAILIATLYSLVKQRLTCLGIGLTITNIHGVSDLNNIPNTQACEDLHLEATTGHLFTACQVDYRSRSKWFPPFGVLNEPKADIKGTIVRIDPETFTATELKVNGFTGNFVTHGIDILNDADDPSTLWIYVVNHLANPERYGVHPPISHEPERAHVEIFRHSLGSDEVDFVRSVRHPLIRMPNDALADTPTSFYVTDDHVYRDGVLRLLEDIVPPSIAPASKVIHVQITDMETADPTAGLNATIALHKIHNNNGLGRGSPHHPEEVLVIDAAGGLLIRSKRNTDPWSTSKQLTLIEQIQLDSTLDNPSYYWDPYATASNNATGYILPGMRKAAAALSAFEDSDIPVPSAVWHVRSAAGPVDFDGASNKWEKRLIFQDDGKSMRAASGAVMVGIDPDTNEGKKQAWLFVTGFGSRAMVVAKIDL